MNIILIIVAGLLSRCDGFGRGTPLFPIWPFNLLKCGGINYMRGAIGIPVYLMSGNPWHLISYFLVGITFWIGEGNWLTKLVGDKWCWFIVGLMYGLASFVPLYSLWFGCTFFLLVYLSRHDLLDWSYAEFLHGALATVIFLWTR